MRDSNKDPLDSRTIMDDSTGGLANGSGTNFAFAFNDSKFSDRVLRIEIIRDSSVSTWEDIMKETGMRVSFIFLGCSVCACGLVVVNLLLMQVGSVWLTTK